MTDLTRRKLLAGSIPVVVGAAVGYPLYRAATLDGESLGSEPNTPTGRSKPGVERVLFDHDGGLEDFISLLLLMSYEHVQLQAVSVTPADCLGEPAAAATRKFLDFGGHSNVPVALGKLDGRNPFPLPWRLSALQVNEMPFLNRQPGPKAELAKRPAHEVMAQTLLKASQPMTVLVTGPLTNLAWVLTNHPECETKIKELVWMGGALKVAGNVDLPHHDGSAEWNVFWDPAAAKRVWDSKIPITMVGLDATNAVPVTSELCHALAKQSDHPFSNAAATIWAMTFGTKETTGSPYCCWDSLATSYLAAPELCDFTEIRCEIVTAGRSEGRTRVTSSGRSVKAAMSADANGFYQHCVKSLRYG